MAHNIFTNSFLSKTQNLINKSSDKALEWFYEGKDNWNSADVLSSEAYPNCESVILAKKDSGDDFQLNNAIKIFEALPITPYLASDPRFWTYLSLVTFRGYLADFRDPKKYLSYSRNSEKDARLYILSHYFCSSSVADLLRNDISLLWWVAHLTVSDDDRDKYRLTREVFTTLDYTRNLLPGTQGRAKAFRHAVLEFVVDNPGMFKTSKEGKVRLIMRRLNTKAGYNLIAALSKNEIKALISDLSQEIIDYQDR